MTTYAWCDHCHRAYDGYSAAPAPNTPCPLCGGSAYDQFPWAVMRRDYPELPETPIAGAHYEVDAESPSAPAVYYTPRAVLEIIEPRMGSGAFLAELASNPPWGQS